MLSAKITSLLLEELDMPNLEVRYWIDSTIVIAYIQNEKRRYKTFVGNRCKKFRAMAKKHQIRHVSTHENPADDASRGLSVHDKQKVDRWFQAPSFLRKKDEEFLDTTIEVEVTDDDPEIQKEVKSNTACVIKDEAKDILSQLGSWTSSWIRMKCIVAAIYIFTECARGRRDRSTKRTIEDITIAESLLIKMVQAKHFLGDINTLKHSGAVSKSSRVRKLDPFLDDKGVMRVGGRLKRSNMSNEMKHPVILPKGEIIVRRIVEWHHRRIQHLGRTATLCELRSQGYWLISGNSQVRQVVYSCVPCRVFRGQPTAQKMADLPEKRMEDAPPVVSMCSGIF